MISSDELLYNQRVSEVFDRFAEPGLTQDILNDRRDRAIALACMIAYDQGHYDWPGIIDSAMKERGVETRFSELPVRQMHIDSHRAAGVSGELTKRCNSLSSIIVALCKD